MAVVNSQLPTPKYEECGTISCLEVGSWKFGS